MMIESFLGRASAGEDLAMDEMSEVVDQIMQGRWSEQQMALLLTALRVKGESVDEVAGAAAALRRHMRPIRTRRQGLLDTCGTGGDSSATFNVSTAAALVAAASGTPVAKHGNRSVTSRSGSADVFAALGVDIEAPVETVEMCLDELGVCFCFAPLLHPSMKQVAGVRRSLGVRTIFNMLGPLCNPASAPFQLLGVGQPHFRPLLASALERLGVGRACVVCGEDGMDEVTLSGATEVTEVTSDGQHQLRWSPADFGLSPGGGESLVVDGPEASAAVIRDVLAGKAGPPRTITVLNAAAALWTARADESLEVCARRAAQAIDSGAARRLLEQLVEASHAR